MKHTKIGNMIEAVNASLRKYKELECERANVNIALKAAPYLSLDPTAPDKHAVALVYKRATAIASTVDARPNKVHLAPVTAPNYGNERLYSSKDLIGKKETNA